MKSVSIAAPPPPGGPSRPDRATALTRRLLTLGAIAGPLFVVVFLAEGATRAGYDPLRHPVSSLELGDGGWVQTANFLVAGFLSLAYAAGLRRALKATPGPARGSVWGPRLVGVWALALVAAGVFTTDPVSGYPSGTPDRLTEYGSVHAALHDLLSLGGFVALVAACLVFARRFAARGERGWALYSALSAAVFTAAMVLANIAFSQAEGLVAFGGLFQRISVTAGWCWLTLLAVRTARHLRRPERA
ncbi:DUF998 domain-containing protein [Microbispora sp. NPDC049125]|uniref:DUF998 domain-containing protein n=1 Tax=Microbispora sp. NPDC049125 TaxID=3154929 RepID=UPI0034651B02